MFFVIIKGNSLKCVLYIYLTDLTLTILKLIYVFGVSYRKQEVFMSANYLINQTNLIMKTVKEAC